MTDEVPEPYAADIRLDAIEPGENLSREYYGDIEALANAIHGNQWVAPLQVSVSGRRFTLHAGHRRYKALCLLRDRGDWGSTAPAQVFTTFNDAKMAAINVAENTERLQPNLAEVLNTYRQLHERYGWGKDEIAVRLGKSVAHVGNCIRAAKGLHPTILKAVRNGGESSGFSMMLLFRLASMTHKEQLEWLEQRSATGNNASASDKAITRLRTRKQIERAIQELEELGQHGDAELMKWVLGQRDEPWRE